jgi:hypothetical protein
LIKQPFGYLSEQRLFIFIRKSLARLERGFEHANGYSVVYVSPKGSVVIAVHFETPSDGLGHKQRPSPLQKVMACVKRDRASRLPFAQRTIVAAHGGGDAALVGQSAFLTRARSTKAGPAIVGWYHAGQY